MREKKTKEPGKGQGGERREVFQHGEQNKEISQVMGRIEFGFKGKMRDINI